MCCRADAPVWCCETAAAPATPSRTRRLVLGTQWLGTVCLLLDPTDCAEYLFHSVIPRGEEIGEKEQVRCNMSTSSGPMQAVAMEHFAVNFGGRSGLEGKSSPDPKTQKHIHTPRPQNIFLVIFNPISSRIRRQPPQGVIIHDMYCKHHLCSGHTVGHILYTRALSSPIFLFFLL